MANNLFEWLEIESKGGESGSLMMFQQGAPLPFSIGKVLVVRDVPTNALRGKHAHKKVREVVVALQGGCTVEVTDGTNTETAVLNDATKGVLLPALVWRTLKDFQPNTILLIVADGTYDEDDYIRNYDDFLRLRA